MVAKSGHGLGVGSQFLVDFPGVEQFAVQVGQGVEDRRLAFDALQGAAKRLGRLARLGQGGLSGHELILFAGQGIHLGDLGVLEFQELAFFLKARRLGVEVADGGGHLAQFPGQAVFFGQKRRIGQEAVEEGGLEGGLEQPPLAVLGDVEQKLGAQGGQGLAGG